MTSLPKMLTGSVIHITISRYKITLGLLSVIFFVSAVLLSGCKNELPLDVKKAYSDLPEEVDFNIHVRPILSDRCFACHGPDQNSRKADLRLDLEESAYTALEVSGETPFVRGNLNESAAWQRIISDDPEYRMPPPNSHLELSPKEKALIAKWIEQGALWKRHWAFIPPEKPEVPKFDASSDLKLNEIDHFIRAKLKDLDLNPSPVADKERLIRRATMDLTGLPPTIPEIDAFLADNSPDAYENLIDRLMNTDAYAERMAMEWLDVARYADSHGLHSDGMRENWPWRDWVIKAFKDNLSYKDFATWQLAGDLLPNATREQILATGFHRNHPINAESGIVSEEFRLVYVADRTNTTATAFMGLTTECASCHDHKFDPISQKEFYQMSAFFNNVPELGMTGTDKNFGPLLMLPDPETEQEINRLSTEIDQLSKRIELRKASVEKIKSYIDSIDPIAIEAPKPDVYFPLESITERKNKDGRVKKVLDQNPKGTASGDAEVVPGKFGNAVRIDKDNEQLYLDEVKNFDLDEGFSGGAWVKIEDEGSFQTIMGNIGNKNTAWRGWIFYLDSLNRPGVKIVHSLSHNYLHVTTDKVVPIGNWTSLFFTYDGSAKANGIKIFFNGEVLENTIHHDNLYKNILPVRARNYTPDYERAMKLGIAHNYLFTDTDNASFVGSYDEIRIYHKHLTELEVGSVYRKEIGDPRFRPVLSEHAKRDYFLLRKDQEFRSLYEHRAKLKSKQFEVMDPVHEVMVMAEMSPARTTHVLERGVYTNLGEIVEPLTPQVLPPFSDDLAQNRLGLAQWLFSDDHPLTARVTVNRYWQMIFGTGIVDTPHDFGMQGSLPSHPELLDWLAVEFRESGWDVRHLLKLMLTSATYKQSAVATAEQMSKDPKNIYLARGSSFRLPAEMIRDNALAASGLLSRTVGGESVKPYQPKGLWKDKNEFSGFLNNYIQDSGDSLYRRSMYTFIRRTSPHPAMIALDAPDRSRCIVKRENTNTPLQALVLMNDPQFVEAARVLAERVQKEGGENFEEQAEYAFRLVCSRRPSEKELELMKEQYELALTKYQKDPSAAENLLEVGDYPFDNGLDQKETAALTMVTNLVMNFDEAYMKR